MFIIPFACYPSSGQAKSFRVYAENFHPGGKHPSSTNKKIKLAVNIFYRR